MPVQKSGQSLEKSTYFSAYFLLPTKQFWVVISIPPQMQSSSVLHVLGDSLTASGT
ncbi:MAG: hypothetical protein QW666_00410 [Candidatus Woesearchaeota archaeon]